MTTHRYVSWLRRGISAARTSGAVVGANPTVVARVSIGGTPSDVPVTLHGPGDIAQLAAAAIVRRDPAPSALGVSPSTIAFVELAPADLPWRFSPAVTPGAPQTHMVPWLALAVVPASNPFGPRSGAPLLVLSTTRAELPDLDVVWAWAHVQIEEPAGGIPGNDVAAQLRAHPQSAVARLLAPRRFEPRARYRACLVPVYEAGRRAGLGIDVGNAGVALAWSSAAPPTTAIELPVYDSWLIETGDADDFETIARRLRGGDPDQLFVPLPVDVAAAADRTEPLVATSYGLLRPPHGEATLPEAAAIAGTLAPWLATDDASESVIGPPLYAAAQTAVASLAGTRAWQRTLNLDPRRRAQAAAGASIVRADQEQLVADARAAIGQLERANAIVRGTQLAVVLAQRVRDRHVAQRPPGRIVATLWPTLAGSPAAAAVPAVARGLLSPAMRRIARPAGPLARGRVAGVAWSRIGHDLSLEIQAVPLSAARAVTLGGIRAAPAHTPTPVRVIAPARITAIRAGLAVRAARVRPVVQVTPAAPVDASAVAARALAAAATLGIARRAAVRIEGLPVVARPIDLVELRVAPDLSRPMADRLAELRPELFAPGIGDMPPDTATVLGVDPAAVEAILAGANDELMRELAWRGVAIDRRMTLLRQLWARAVRDPGPAHDVPPIASWTRELGGNTATAPTVFVVRSELVRRFPDAVYSCVRAVVDPQLGRKPADSGSPLMPMFRGRAAPDVAYVGFARPLAELAGADDWAPGSTRDPGWYFAIQERPGHTRFGLDARPSTGNPEWVNLSWPEVVPDTELAAARPYIRLDHPPSRPYPSSPRWAGSAASMAAITERPAVRIAIHVQELLAR